MGIAFYLIPVVVVLGFWALFRAPRRTDAASRPVTTREQAPGRIEQPSLVTAGPMAEAFEIAANLHETTGAPILDFDALDDWAANAATPEDQRRLRQAGRRAWLLHLRDWLAPQVSLPLWLDEGLAVNTEHRISASQQHHTRTVELLGQHKEFWNDTTIQEFWTGRSFHRTDEGNSLSYDLARAMVELVGRDWGTFVRFAKAARRDDGGASAAREVLGMDLGDLAAAAINAKPKNSWAPRPDSWERVSVKA